MLICIQKRVTAKYAVYLLSLVNLGNNPHRTKSYQTMAATIFLMIVLVVSASTIIMVPPNTEATILSDYCEEYEFLCDEETPPPDARRTTDNRRRRFSRL